MSRKKGFKLTNGHKRKIALAMKGRKPSPKTIEASVKARKGKKLPKWLRKKLSDYWKTHEKKGRWFKGMTPWNKGLKGYQAGRKHYNWKGGITKENDKLHGSAEYKNWRKAVFQRDNYACQVCHNRSEKGKRVYLMAHHIKDWKHYPKLRFIVSNGITLCRKCHWKVHKKLLKIPLIRRTPIGTTPS